VPGLVAMQEVVGSSPIIRFARYEKYLQSTIFCGPRFAPIWACLPDLLPGSAFCTRPTGSTEVSPGSCRSQRRAAGAPSTGTLSHTRTLRGEPLCRPLLRRSDQRVSHIRVARVLGASGFVVRCHDRQRPVNRRRSSIVLRHLSNAFLSPRTVDPLLTMNARRGFMRVCE
jgi:hypothetical protein